jgi:predicted permease
MRSFGNLIAVDPGFEVDRLAVVDLQLARNRYGAAGAGLAFMRELERRIEDSGLQAVITGGSPPTGGGMWFDVRPQTDDGRTIDLEQAELSYSAIDPEYFAIMDIAMVEGRTFAPDDPAEAVIINSVIATRFFGDASPIGRRFRVSERQPWMTVVGVAADVKQSGPNETRDEEMEFYQPFGEKSATTYFSLIVRAAHPAAALMMIKQKVWEIDPQQPLVGASTMTERLRESIARPRFYLTLSSAFAMTGALLAAIGVYGVAAYWVTRRRREIAIRIALGASRQKVMSMVLTRAMKLAAAGTIAGLALAAAGTRVIESMLFGITGRDPVTLSIVAALLAALVLIGGMVPALRAARVDPMTTLRSE